MTLDNLLGHKAKSINEIPSAPRMTQEDFSRTIKIKGWTQQELAARWGYSSGRDIRRIAQNIERLPRYVDAVHGLPYLIKK